MTKKRKVTDKEMLQHVARRIAFYVDGQWAVDPLPQFTTQKEIDARLENLATAIRSEARRGK